MSAPRQAKPLADKVAPEARRAAIAKQRADAALKEAEGLLAGVYGQPPAAASPRQSAGGGGGSVLGTAETRSYALSPKSERESESLTHSLKGEPEGSSTAIALAGTLLDEGVLVLSSAKRLACAESMADDGVTVDDLRALVAFVKDSEHDTANQRRYLAGILMDPAKRREAVANLRRFVTADTQRRRDQEFGRRIRLENIRSVERFEREWREFCEAKKAGNAPAVERLRMPWEGRTQ